MFSSFRMYSHVSCTSLLYSFLNSASSHMRYLCVCTECAMLVSFRLALTPQHGIAYTLSAIIKRAFCATHSE